MKCTPRVFGGEIARRVMSLPSSSTEEEKVQNLIKSIQEVAEGMQVDTFDVEDVFKSMSRILRSFKNRPDDNEIKQLLTQWKQPTSKSQEDTTSKNLNKHEEFEKFNEDVWESAYGSAAYAKIRAKQHAATIGVRSILYNENGIISSSVLLNESVRNEQEKLLQNVIEYIKTQIPKDQQDSEIFGDNVRMYKDGFYTGIVEKIQSLYGNIFDEFDTNFLNYNYNNRNFKNLDAFSSWVILNNFDDIMQKIYGKAITIDPDSAKFSADNSKYSIAGGSNVYNTWRTSEEIDLSKEINNISQVIIISLPYINRGTTTPSNKNLKFNEFTYLITKLKDIPNQATKDWIPSINEISLISDISQETKDYLDDKSILDLIKGIRENPQEILPVLFEIFNSDEFRDKLEANGIINKNTFYDIDLDIINSLYQGLFNPKNENSLISIQNKSGYDTVNYFSFIGQTIDSIYKASFLQYFKDSEGRIIVRNMYDQSVSNIEYTIKDTINSINSQLYISNYGKFKDKYSINHTIREDLSNGNYYVQYNNEQYLIQVNDKGINASKGGQIIEDNSLKQKLLEQYYKNRNLPSDIQFTIEDFHAGPLTINVNLTSDYGKITYSVNGISYTFRSKKDYDSLSNLIQSVLKQNLDINLDYFQAYQNITGEYSKITESLMQLVSRTITNQYISNEFLKGLNPSSTRSKLKEIFGDFKSITPHYNNKLNEISFIVDADEEILSKLAQANAIATGRLTSSQILDGEGNALAASTLSRLISTLDYQVIKQVKQPNAAAFDFSLWNQGVFKGIQQLKEFKDRDSGDSKSHTQFTGKEMITALVFTDFVQGMLSKKKTLNSALGEGLVSFLPSENSDKTYIGRMLIDLNQVKIPYNDQEVSIYKLLQEDITNIKEVYPLIIKEFGKFYQKALDNINEDWGRVETILDQQFVAHNFQNEINPINEYDYNAYVLEYGSWDKLNLLAQAKGKSPLAYLSEIITAYNNNNPQNPIVLIDQVHYVADKSGNLKTNKSFIENVSRFNDYNGNQFYDFMYDQKIDVLKTMLKDKVDIEANDDIKSLLGEHAKEWIDPQTNKIILAKVIDAELETIQNIRYSRDFTPELEQEIQSDNSPTGLVLNPIIDAYNTLNYFFTQEFMNSSVGAFYAHPSKNDSTVYADEKSRKAAQDKRNVSMTAAMHPFIQNLIQGIPPEINIAIMPDLIDTLQTVSGDVFDLKPFDGATFENPFFGLMENASLGGAKVGQNKKTFTHYYDQRTGTGGIIKTANFPLSNYLIRRSDFYKVMMQNMTDRVWKDKSGKDFILPKSNGQLIDYNGKIIELTNTSSQDGRLYFEKDGKYYKIQKVEVVGSGSLLRILQEVDKNGNVIREEFVEHTTNEDSVLYDVNTNYKLWKFFGGENSMELKDGELTYSENSIKLVYNLINKIGTKNEGVDVVKYQSQIDQPLKHADIHIMPTVGAVKQGAGNINNTDAYKVADSTKINFMKIKMNQAGIQLDKEHHANGEDLSIMTQVLSACAARGYSHEQTQDMYNALAALAKAGIREHLEAFDEFFENPNGFLIKKDKNGNPIFDINGEPEKVLDKNGNPILTKNNYQEVIVNTLIDAFAHSTNESEMLQMVTRTLLDKTKKGEEIAFKDKNIIPYSDPSVFRRLHSTISVALTRAAIKIKVDGILSVLCPSFNIMKLYNGRTLDSYKGKMSEIVAEQNRQDSLEKYELVNTPSKVQVGRTYKIIRSNGETTFRTIKTHNQYYAFRQFLKDRPGDIISVREQFAPAEGFEGGRELASYNCTFKESVSSIPQSSMIAPKEIENQINSISNWDKKLQKAQELGLDVDLDTTPRNLEEYISQNFPTNLTPDSIKKELGWNSQDLKRMISVQKSEEKGGVSIAKAAELIENELIGTPLEGQAKGNVRDIILSMLAEAQTPNDLTKLIYKSRIKEALDLYRSQYDQEQWNIQQQLVKGPRQFNFYDLKSVRDLALLKEEFNNKNTPFERKVELKPLIDQALQRVQNDLAILHGNGKTQLETIDGIIELDSRSIQHHAYEVIMPKVFAKQFGLKENDNLSAIEQDPDFFTKRLVEKITTPEISDKYYTIALHRLGKGQHVYLLNPKDAVETNNFKKKSISVYKENGKIWRIRNNEKFYEMKKGDEVWEYTSPSGKRIEVIVTKNFSHYINTQSFNTIRISDNVVDDTTKRNNIIKILERNTRIRAIDDYVNKFYNLIEEYAGTTGLESQVIKLMQDISIDELEDSPMGDYFKKLGREIHTSFLKSLEVVAARIPAQSMQSFMPMKVVAFEGPDINTAYVATAQFLFQGSDLDIDAVSLASYAFSKSGKYIMHSPYANIESYELLKASETLPFPTGEILQIGENIANYDQLVSYGTEQDIKDPSKPFHIVANQLRINTSTLEAIRKLSIFLKYCNSKGYIPNSNNSRLQPLMSKLQDIINRHNQYIYDSNVEKFSKNYVVTSMYNIGIDPINLIESQQAMDSITGPLKSVANSTIKAQDQELGNVGNFVTNLHGIIQNMSGKSGVNISAHFIEI